MVQRSHNTWNSTTSNWCCRCLRTLVFTQQSTLHPGEHPIILDVCRTSSMASESKGIECERGFGTIFCTYTTRNRCLTFTPILYGNTDRNRPFVPGNSAATFKGDKKDRSTG